MALSYFRYSADCTLPYHLVDEINVLEYIRKNIY